MKRLSIFVSGNGTNLQRIAEYFVSTPDVEIVNVVCNNPKAYALERARKLGLPVRLVTRTEFDGPAFVEEMAALDLDLIVLAGFLWKVPVGLIQVYPHRIVNIHPALLPKYGGKGYYGQHVHEAVIAAGEAYSGITIHYVDEIYDNGEIILQAYVALEPGETAETLAAKIHKLEQGYYPVTIRQILFWGLD